MSKSFVEFGIVLMIVLMIAIFFYSCTDASRSRMLNLGGGAHVVCYSGGKVIYDNFSTGKVKSEEKSDGYYFQEKDTGNLIELTGNCVFTYK